MPNEKEDPIPTCPVCAIYKERSLMIIEAIQAEIIPEGEFPDFIWEELQDRKSANKFMRTFLRVTKDNIFQRATTAIQAAEA